MADCSPPVARHAAVLLQGTTPTTRIEIAALGTPAHRMRWLHDMARNDLAAAALPLRSDVCAADRNVAEVPTAAMYRRAISAKWLSQLG
jgi:hypothetical protein